MKPQKHRHLGLTLSELKYVDGFALHGLTALADLRQCWLLCSVAEDAFVRRGVERSMFELLATEPMQLRRDKCLVVLKHGLDLEQQNMLMNALWPRPWGRK